MNHHHLAAALSTALFASQGLAQCVSDWLPGDPLTSPIVDAYACALFDPDGAGPLPSALAVGGNLRTRYEDPATGVLVFDGTGWNPLGNLGGTVTALQVWNGELYAAAVTGAFPSLGTTVARWDGAAWQVIGTGVGESFAMTVYGGQLIVGGSLQSIDGNLVSGIVRWNGSSWSSLGTGIVGNVRTMVPFGSSLWVGGSISSAGGVSCSNLALWNGSSWSSGPRFNAPIYTMATRFTVALSNYLYVGGAFQQYTIGAQTFGASRVARYEDLSGAWTAVAGGLPDTVTALSTRNVGFGYEMVAGTNSTNPASRCWRFNGTSWSSMGSVGTQQWTEMRSFRLFGGNWVAALYQSDPCVVTWNGSQWVPLRGQGIPDAVRAVEPRSGQLVIGGSFASISGVAMGGIAQGEPGAWSPVGGGTDGTVHCLTTAGNGDLIAGGAFATAGGAAAANIARWNGSTWSAIGTGLDGPVYAVLALPGNELIATGDFIFAGAQFVNRIARWNGVVWQPMASGLNGSGLALARLPDGKIVVGGAFTSVASRIAQWNGTSWSALGLGCNDRVNAIAVGLDGSLFAAGRFTLAGGAAMRVGKWNGAAWSPVVALGVNNEVCALSVHPNGDLLIGGYLFSFTVPFGGTLYSNLLRVRPSGSSSFLGLRGNAAYDLTIDDDDVVAVGELLTGGGISTTNVARYHTPCPAAATPYGAGCSGLTAPLSLTATSAPWLGGSYQLRAATFGPVGVAVTVLGYSSFTLPLPPVLPGSLPGCTGYASPDSLGLALPNAGVLTFGGPVPNATSLIGAQLHAQVLQLEDQAGVTRISSSNGVHLTLGTW